MKLLYSIVSIGTERSGSKGYMAIISDNKNMYICNLPHFPESYNKRIVIDSDSLRVESTLAIELVALSRFQLISALGFHNTDLSVYKKICIIGSGAVGITAYFEFKRLGINNVCLKTMNAKKEAYYRTLKIEIDSTDSFDYDCFIEATGAPNQLSLLLDNINPNSSIYLLGTPRKSKFIDPLIIHRKNLKIFGCHEIYGVDKGLRQELFNQLCQWYESFNITNCQDLVKIHMASQENLKKILNYNFIQPINILSY